MSERFVQIKNCAVHKFVRCVLRVGDVVVVCVRIFFSVSDWK